MKQISIKILFILLIISPFKVKASTLDLKMSCPKTAYQEDTIECQITYTNEISLNAIIVKYKLPQEIKYQELKVNTNWNSYYKDKNGFVLGSTTNTNNNIATLKLKISPTAQVNKEYKLELTDIDASDTNFNSISKENFMTTIKIIKKENDNQTSDNNDIQSSNSSLNKDTKEELNNDSKLKSIKLSYGTINFSKDIFEYKIAVPNNVTNINIEAIPNFEKANVTIDKPNELIVGINLVTITVEAEDKTISKYIIIIDREKKLTESDIIEESVNSILPNLNYLIYIIIFILIILSFIIIKRRNSHH